MEPVFRKVDCVRVSVPDAIEVITKAGGRVIEGPFGIAIEWCAVIEDPFGNGLVILDASRGSITGRGL